MLTQKFETQIQVEKQYTGENIRENTSKTDFDMAKTRILWEMEGELEVEVWNCIQ